MSWGMWFATFAAIFVFILLLAGLGFCLIDKVEASVKIVIEFYLQKRKKMITDLEDRFGDKGKGSFGTAH